MWRLICFVTALGLCTSYAKPARAGFALSGSVGSGYRLNGDTGRIPTNIMVAPGFDILGNFFRFDVGLLANLPDVEDANFDIQVRPSLMLRLPVLPLYVRAIVGFEALINGPITLLFGGGIGLEALLLNTLGVFVEADLLPRAFVGDYINVLEGRLGLSLEFN